MLKERDRKTIVLLVIFGVALVSVVTSIAAGILNSLTIFCCSGRLRTDKDFYYLVAGLLLGLCALGVAYVVVKIFVRKKLVPSFVLSFVIACYTIATIIALCYSIPLDSNGYYREEYFNFYMTTHVSVSVSLAISVVLTEVSHFLLKHMDRKAVKEETQQEQPQVSGEQE